MAQQQLSGTIVVIIIAVGVQACIIVFIFLKRQVQRLAMRHRRGPYTSVCSGAPKVLRRETDRLLNYVQEIRHEPRLQMDTSTDHRRDYRRQIILSFQVSRANTLRNIQFYGLHNLHSTVNKLNGTYLTC